MVCGPGEHRFTSPPAFDLSKFPKLRDIEFDPEDVSIRWIIETLQAAKPISLEQITIHTYEVPSDMEEMAQEWRDLDRLLSQLWTSDSMDTGFSSSECNL